MNSFSNVTVDSVANVYFEGKVVSHTIHLPDGSRKTLGIIAPGSFYFGTAAIHANSTNINASDSPAMSGVTTVDTKNLAIYLGKVVVDADGNGVVTQYRKSDAEVHAPLLTAPITVSTDTSGGANTITGGSDGGAYLP